MTAHVFSTKGSRTSRRSRLMWATVGASAVALVAGCGGTTSSDTPDWAQLCSDVDVQALSAAGEQLVAANAQLDQLEVTDTGAIEPALAAQFRAASALLGAQASELGPIYTAASQEFDDQALGETAAQLQTASDGFSQLATDLEAEGLTPEFEAEAEQVSSQVDAINSDFAVLETELGDVPECQQLNTELSELDVLL